MPFLTAGDPSLDATAALIDALPANGADLFEVGIPYSDPIADGPVIAASYTRALKRGSKVDSIFQMLRERREQGSTAPIVTMVSYSIVLRIGIPQYIESAVNAGVDGLIVPDLPIEESENLLNSCQAANLKLIQLITPTTPRDRAIEIARTSTGFIYYVSVAGLTGERTALPENLADNVTWLRQQTSLPICIGFGISQADHIRALAPVADGLIVGSAVVRRLAECEGLAHSETVDRIGGFIAELASGLKE